MKRNVYVRIFAGAVAVCLLSFLHAQAAYIEVLFNDPVNGPDTVNTGTAGGIFSMMDASWLATNLRSASGGGVSGAGGDYAFDNTASYVSGGGGNFIGGRAESNFGGGGFASLTLMGWMNNLYVSTDLGKDGRIFRGGGTGADIDLLFSGGPGTLEFGIDGNTVIAPSASAWDSATTSWTFFAVSYDGTVSSGNVQWYVGDYTTPVSAVGAAQTLNEGAVSGGAGIFAIGGLVGGNNRAFDGYLDNIRMFASTVDNSGVLSLAEIEEIRFLDAPVPEPSIVASLMLGLVCVWSVGKSKIRL